MVKKTEEPQERRQKCDAEGWCHVMDKAVESTGQGRKGLRVVEFCDRKTGELSPGIAYDFGKAGWASLRVCPFCEGNPNARFVSAEARQMGGAL